MAQEPDQQPTPDHAPDPQYPYGATPSVPPESAASPSYDSPLFYDQPQHSGNTPPPQTYESQGAYAPPSQNPYGVPPQVQYGVASGYGHGAPPQRFDYGYPSQPRFVVPPASPLPLNEALKGLPAQYMKASFKPSYTTYAAEMGKAKWNIVWIQLIIYAIIITLLGILSIFLSQFIPVASTTTTTTTTNGITPEQIAHIQNIITNIAAVNTYGQIIITPLTIFVTTGILFLLAKAFGGEGTFLNQLYTSLLFIVPLGIIGNIISLLFVFIPGVGLPLVFLVSLGRLAYEGVLFGIMLVPVHRLSGGRATGAVLLLYGIGFVLLCILAFVFLIIITAAINPA